MSTATKLKQFANEIMDRARDIRALAAAMDTGATPPPTPPTAPPVQPPVVPMASGLPWSVAPPKAPITTRSVSSDKIWHVGGLNDVILAPATVDGGEHGVHGQLNESTSRVTSNGVVATGIHEYGFYAAPIFDHHHKNMTLKQAAGANQAMIRLAGDRVIFENGYFDTWDALNDTLRLYGYTDDVTKPSRYCLINCLMRGGPLNFGVPPANDANDDYPKNPVYVWIYGGKFEYNIRYQNDQPQYAAGILGRKRIKEIHIDGLTMTGSGRVLDIDDPTAVTIKGMHYNGTLITQGKVGSWIQGGNLSNVVVTP